MRLFIATVTLWALASAKPEMYKEKEDFQFSRSSSDDGSKSGYYGAQRGNMGGNYERAHNMDSLAQHQMSTLVRQVDGEIGEGANTRTGSVFTSGNSRGIYGSGNYDLSNLKGRNFEESASRDDLYSSSLISQNSRNLANIYSGINNAKYSGSQLEASGLSAGYQSGGLTSEYNQAQDNQRAESQYHGSSSNYQYGGQGASQYKYYSHGSSQARNDLDQSANLQSNNNYNANIRSRLISTAPHRIYVRPGTRVTIPIAAQTYDASHSSLSQQQSAVNTEAEILNSDRNYAIKTVGVPKHYESSYSYRKEWEKHDTQPISNIPTENPFPKNSELYEDAQISGASGKQYQSEVDSTNVLSSNLNSAQSSSTQLSSLNSAQLSSLNSAQLSSLNSAHSNSLNSAHSRNLNSVSSSGYSGNANSAASNRLLYASQTQNADGFASSSDLHQVNAQNLGESNLYNNLNLVDGNSKPKSYQSSYSYHKSWERRGDPYIIKPAGSDISSQMSQKLVADSASYGTQSHSQYGSHYSQSQDDCVEPTRYKRSYNTQQYQQHQFQQSQEEKDKQFEFLEFGQQSNNQWKGLENLDQQAQNKWDFLQQSQENLGQQTQNSWGNLKPAEQHHNQLEDLGQQTQNTWGNLESFGQDKNQIGQLEDLGQQTQNSWGNLDSFGQHQNQVGKLEDLGQQTQNSWGNLDSFGQHQNQVGKLEDLGQQTQNSWGNLESFGQHENQVGKLEDLGQQTQNSWGNLESFGQHESPAGKLEDLGQQTQNSWGNLESFGQHESPAGKLEDLGQQTQNSWGNLESFGQHESPAGKLEDLGQQTQNSWGNLESFGQNQNQVGKLEDLGQQTQNSWGNLESFGQHENPAGKLEDLGQQTQNSWGNLESFGQNQNKIEKLEDLGQQKQSAGDHPENLDQQSQNTWSHLDNLGQQTQYQNGKLEDLDQKTQSNKVNIEPLDDQSQIPLETLDLGQQTQGMWDNADTLTHQDKSQVGKLEGQQTQNSWGQENLNSQSQSQIEQIHNIGQETQNIWDHTDKFAHQDQNQIGKIEDLGQQAQISKIEELGQETQKTWDNLDNFGKQSQLNWNNVEHQQTQGQSEEIEGLTPQKESKSSDQQSFSQQTQNGWNQIEDIVSPSGPQVTSNLEKTLQDKIENGNQRTTAQENVNLWNNNYNFELQKHHDERTNINQQTQNNFWHEQSINTQTLQQNSFDSWQHSLQSANEHKFIPQDSGNNEDQVQWDIIDKLIEESEKKEKNESLVLTNGHSSTSYNNQNHDKTTEKSITETTQIHVNNGNVFDDTDFKNNIGRGDIGPEDIHNEKSDENDESLNLTNQSKANDEVNKQGRNFYDKPVMLNVIGLESQKSVSTSTSKPKQHRINNLNKQSFLEERKDNYQHAYEHQDNHQHASVLNNIEQQNLEQQYEVLEQTSSMNDKSLLDFSQQAQILQNDNLELLSQSNSNKLEVQSHVSHEYQAVTQKNKDLSSESKIISNKVEQPVEVTTEEPGFWKSVWGKTVNVKDKVVGWFKN